MLQNRLKAAQNVLPHLKAAETTIDLALSDSARLIVSLVEARDTAGMAITFGAEAFDRAGAYLNILLSARREIVTTHAALADVRDQMGLSTRMSGGLGDKPNVEPAETKLTVAA